MEKVVFTAAIMDYCHEGHVNLLTRMREEAGKGVVALVLHTDESCYSIKKVVPTHTTREREDAAKSTGLVDSIYITCQDDPSYQFDQILKDYPSHEPLFMRGDDNLDPPGRWYLDEYEIAQIYIPYTEGISSTILREQ